LRLRLRKFNSCAKDCDGERIYTISIKMSNRFDAIIRPEARYGGEYGGRRGKRNSAEGLQPDDHDFGGFHERGDRLAFF
jgi:hypothetical protein